MQKSYSERLRKAQLAGLCAAGETRQWRADRLADAPGPEEDGPWSGAEEQAEQRDTAPKIPAGRPFAGGKRGSRSFFDPAADPAGPEEGWPWPVEETAKGGRPGGQSKRRRAQKRRRAAKPANPAARPQSARPAGWSDEEVVECRGCWYWRMLDATLGIWACWYPLIEDRLRPCRPADCYRHAGTPYRPCDASGRPLDERPHAAGGPKQTPAKDPCGTDGERKKACREKRKERCGEECRKACGEEHEEHKEEYREECKEGCRERCKERRREKCRD